MTPPAQGHQGPKRKLRPAGKKPLTTHAVRKSPPMLSHSGEKKQSGKVLELRLQIRYNGLKATQYFTKFTPESQTVAREDLTALKLPHPKKDQMHLLSHGCVECIWQNVPPDGVLHRNVAMKSENPDRKLLDRLSIVNVLFKEIREHALWLNNGLKRPRPPSDVPHGAGYEPALRVPLSGSVRLSTSSGQDPSERPSKYARVDQSNVASASLSSLSSLIPSQPPPSNSNSNTIPIRGRPSQANPQTNKQSDPPSAHNFRAQQMTSTRSVNSFGPPPLPPQPSHSSDWYRRGQDTSAEPRRTVKQEDVEHTLYPALSLPRPPQPSTSQTFSLPSLPRNPNRISDSGSSLGAWANEIANAGAPASRRMPLSSSTSSSSSSTIHRPAVAPKAPLPSSSLTSANASRSLVPPMTATTVSLRRPPPPHFPVDTRASGPNPNPNILKSTTTSMSAAMPKLSSGSAQSRTKLPSTASHLPPKPNISPPPLVHRSPAAALLPVSDVPESRRRPSLVRSRRESDAHDHARPRAPTSDSLVTSPTPISVSNSRATEASRPVNSSSVVGGTSATQNSNGPVWIVKEEPIEVSIPPPPAPSVAPAIGKSRSNAMLVDQNENEADTVKAGRVVKDFLKSLHIKMESQNIVIPPPASSSPLSAPIPQTSSFPQPLPSDSAPNHAAQDLQATRITNSPSIPWDLISVALSSASAHNQSVVTTGSGLGEQEVSRSPSKASKSTDFDHNGIHPSSSPSIGEAVGFSAGDTSQAGLTMQAAKLRFSTSALPTPPPSVVSTQTSAPVFVNGRNSGLAYSTSPAGFSATLSSSELDHRNSNFSIQSQPPESRLGVPLTPRASASSASPPIVVTSSSTSTSSQVQRVSDTDGSIRRQIQEEKEEATKSALPELVQLNFTLEDIMAKAHKAALRAQGSRTHEHLSSATRNNTISNLTRESWDIKRQITALVAREGVVIDELERLEARWIPEPVRVGVDEDTRRREREMYARVLKLEKQLDEERKLRDEAENAIMDVRRECKAPFVVPSLLDAFVHLSKLTTKAMRPHATASKSNANPSSNSSAVIATTGSASAPHVASGSQSGEGSSSRLREQVPFKSNHIDIAHVVSNPISSTRTAGLSSAPVRSAETNLKGKEVGKETASSWDTMEVDVEGS